MPTTLTNMGLTSWTSGTDLFDHTQLAANWSAIDGHDHSAGKGLQIPSGGLQNGAVTGSKIATDAVDATKILDGTVGTAELAADSVTTAKILDANITTSKILDANVTTSKIANGGITADKLADAAKVGLSDSTFVRRGKSIIPTTDTRTNTVYGLMTVPDRVQNIVLPTDGIIVVAYQATWQSSVSNGGLAAIFVGSNQVKWVNNAATPPVQEVQIQTATINSDGALSTSSTGLVSATNPGYAGDVTTGQIINAGAASAGGPCYIFAAAGTYDISIQFRALSGSVSVKNRKLWVWTLGF